MSRIYLCETVFQMPASGFSLEDVFFALGLDRTATLVLLAGGQRGGEVQGVFAKAFGQFVDGAGKLFDLFHADGTIKQLHLYTIVSNQIGQDHARGAIIAGLEKRRK